MPPSRYKVVERGRRLVVIDTQTGRPAVRDQLDLSLTQPTAASASKVDDRSGNAVLTTSALYDLRAPRRIVLGDRLSRTLGGWAIGLIIAGVLLTIVAPFLWVGVLFALFQPKLRGAVRSWITAQLDRQDQAAS